MKIGSIKTLALGFAMLFSCINIASAAPLSNQVSEKEAKAAALFQVVVDREMDSKSPWNQHSIKAENPIPVYDITGELSSYIVNLKENGQSMGYVEISADKNQYPVLSYSYSLDRLEGDELSDLNENKSKHKKQKSVVSEKYVSDAPGEFGLMVDYEDGSEQIIRHNEKSYEISKTDKGNIQKKEKPKEDTKALWKSINKITTSELGTTSDGVTDDLAYESGFSQKIYYDNDANVGDIFQYPSPNYWNGMSGCAPTSAANVFIPWINGGYTKLRAMVNGSPSQDQMIMELRNDMGTTWNPSNDEGVTTISNIAPGMVKYAKDHGYLGATAINHSSPSWSTIKSDILNGPSVVTFTGQTFYSPNGGHTVAGVGNVEYVYNGSSTGHQYLMIHDNWNTTPKKVYLAYGRNYTNIWSLLFNPGSK